MLVSNDFIKFIKENNIVESIISIMLGAKTQELVESIIENLIFPFLKRDADNDGEADIKKLEKLNIKFSGIKIEIGKFLITLIKYIIILLIIYYVQKNFKD